MAEGEGCLQITTILPPKKKAVTNTIATASLSSRDGEI